MLFDTITNEQERGPLQEALNRRITYLVSRAESVSEREPDGPDDWRIPMVVATLWIEAAEGTVALGQFEQARKYLHQTVQRLLSLGMPFGAALQRTFFIEDAELSQMAERVMQLWDSYRERDSPMLPSDADDELSVAARESPQQWAYFALADAGADWGGRQFRIGSERLAQMLAGLESVPLGRLRLPLEFYQSIAKFSEGGSQQSESAAEVISTSLLGLFHSVEWARQNTYLWARMLAPAPMFDFDTALLIARTLEVLPAMPTIIDRIQSTLREDARAYAIEFIRAVQALRTESAT